MSSTPGDVVAQHSHESQQDVDGFIKEVVHAANSQWLLPLVAALVSVHEVYGPLFTRLRETRLRFYTYVACLSKATNQGMLHLGGEDLERLLAFHAELALTHHVRLRIWSWTAILPHMTFMINRRPNTPAQDKAYLERARQYGKLMGLPDKMLVHDLPFLEARWYDRLARVNSITRPARDAWWGIACRSDFRQTIYPDMNNLDLLALCEFYLPPTLVELLRRKD